MYHENRGIVGLILNKALLYQIHFYLSGSVFIPMTGLNLSKTLLAANNIVPSPTKKTDQKLVSLHILVPQTECTPALVLCAFVSTTNKASWTKIQWDKTTDTLSNKSSDKLNLRWQTQVEKVQLISQLYMPRQLNVAEASFKRFMGISVHLSAGKRNFLAKVNLESIAKQSHKRHETKPNVTVSHIKTMTLASPQLSS